MNVKGKDALSRYIETCFKCDLLPPHQGATGLPQTAIFAGLWTSQYLAPIDKAMVVEKGLTGSFYRYADDIALISTPDEIDSHINNIKVAAGQLGLVLNENKQKVYPADIYIQRFASDDKCGSLSQQIYRLLSGLYFIPRKYRGVYAADNYEFARLYQLMLEKIEIYLPIHWLTRKLDQKTSLWDRLLHWRYGLKVKLPDFPSDTDSALSLWAEEFVLTNLGWDVFRRGIVDQLVELFTENLLILDSSPDELAQIAATRAIRFASNRLSVLGINPILEPIVEILRHRPWLISHHIILKALVLCGNSDQIVSLAYEWHGRGDLESPNSDLLPNTKLDSHYYLSAVACKSLGFGKASDNSINCLWEILTNKISKDIERVSAAEGLLRLRAWRTEWFDVIATLLKSTERQPFIQKNLILLLASSKDPNPAPIIRDAMARTHHFVVRDAAQYALTENKSIFDLIEPSAIKKYYARKYPSLPVELSDIYSALNL